MESYGPRQGLAEIAIQACARRHEIDEETARRWHVKTRIIIMISICVVIGSVIIYWFISSIIESRRGNQKSGYSSPAHLQRLSNHVLPSEYTLRIIPVLEEGNFTAIGDVRIRIYCNVPTQHIRLHALNISISEVTLKEDDSSKTTKAISKYFSTENDFIDIFLFQLLQSDESYILQIKYVISLNSKPQGLYRSSYVDSETNETRWIAVSNFSPNFARNAFPCFDEPWIKVPFKISIGRKFDMQSHSNAIRRATENIHNMPGYVWDHYEKTLPMSTYLVALLVTDFSSYDVRLNDPPSHRFFSRKEVQRDTEYVGNLIPMLLRAIQNLTGINYELEKLDGIAIPDYGYSAMENWGLLMFRDNYIALLNNSIIDEWKEILASITSHEVAHQWFGNLVTPKWWSDVWLKEGFSSFYGNLALSIVDPSWNLEDAYLSEYELAFTLGTQKNARPLYINLSTIEHLREIFKQELYLKSNCIVNMMYHFLGKSSFLSSVRRYLAIYRYRSADHEDLWNVFQQDIKLRKSFPEGFTLGDIMKTWTHQRGFPILQVERNLESGLVSLTQARFRDYGLNGTDKELWCIPLTWTTEGDRQFGDTLPRAWMPEKYMEINDTGLRQAISKGQWILFNVNQTGLYRVNYDSGNWKLLTKAFRGLPVTAKVQLLMDAFAIANSGLIDYTISWNIALQLETEIEERVWRPAIVALRTMSEKLLDSHDFKFVMCKVVEKVYEAEIKVLNPEDVDWTTWTHFKVSLMIWACSMGHRTCLSFVRDLALRMLRNETSTPIPSELRSWTYCTYVKAGVTEAEWLLLLDKYRDPEATHKDSLLYALGCHNNGTLLKRYISIISAEKNLAEDKKAIDSALISLAHNPEGYLIATDYVTRYWKEMTEDFSATDFVIAMVFYSSSVYMDRAEAKQFSRLKGANDEYDAVIDAVINRAEINDAWNGKHKNQLLRMARDAAGRYAETQDCIKKEFGNVH